MVFEFIVMGCTKRNFYLEEKKNDGFFKENKSDINLYFIPHMFQALISFFFFFSFLLHGPFVYTATMHESCCTSKVIYLLCVLLFLLVIRLLQW